MLAPYLAGDASFEVVGIVVAFLAFHSSFDVGITPKVASLTARVGIASQSQGLPFTTFPSAKVDTASQLQGPPFIPFKSYV